MFGLSSQYLLASMAVYLAIVQEPSVSSSTSIIQGSGQATPLGGEVEGQRHNAPYLSHIPLKHRPHAVRIEKLLHQILRRVGNERVVLRVAQIAHPFGASIKTPIKQ